MRAIRSCYTAAADCLDLTSVADSRLKSSVALAKLDMNSSSCVATVAVGLCGATMMHNE